MYWQGLWGHLGTFRDVPDCPKGGVHNDVLLTPLGHSGTSPIVLRMVIEPIGILCSAIRECCLTISGICFAGDVSDPQVRCCQVSQDPRRVAAYS